jgi:hypothetical protein
MSRVGSAQRARLVGANRWAGLWLGMVLGAAVGVATSFAQADLSGSWASLGNAASPWLVAPFVAGALTVRRGTATVAGLLACTMQVAGYYIATPLRGFAVANNEIAFWTACAVLGGPLFGWAGWAFRRGTGRARLAGSAILPATFIGEATGAYAIRLHYRGDAILFASIGLVLLLGVGLHTRRRGALLAWTVVLAVAGTVLYGPVLRASSHFAFGA